jgi:hypothetical protein
VTPRSQGAYDFDITGIFTQHDLSGFTDRIAVHQNNFGTFFYGHHTWLRNHHSAPLHCDQGIRRPEINPKVVAEHPHESIKPAHAGPEIRATPFGRNRTQPTFP